MDSIDVNFYGFFLSFFFILVYFIFQAENSYTLTIEAKRFSGTKIVCVSRLHMKKLTGTLSFISFEVAK